MIHFRDDGDWAGLETELKIALERETAHPAWPRGLRRRLRRERWAARLESVALALQAILLVIAMAVLRPWTWRAGTGWGAMALAAVLVGAILAAVGWSAAQMAEGWRKSGN